MTTQSIVVYLAVYKTDADAEADYRAAKEQHAAGILKVFDAAVLHRDLSRDVHLVERGQRAPYGMCTGLAVGAFLGVIFPPSAYASAAAWGTSALGAGTGAMVGHFWRGLSREALNELGDLFDLSTAALIVIANSGVKDALSKQSNRAMATLEKRVKADAASFQAALDRAMAEGRGEPT